MMKIRTLALAAVASLSFTASSLAQYQVPAQSIPIGRGAGVQGFDSLAPGAVGTIVTSNGPGVKPSYQPNANVGTITGLTFNGGTKGSPSPLTTGAGTITADPDYSGFATSNCTFSAAVGSNTLTVALKTAAGTDPTTASPCNINYRNPTISTGSTSSVQQTSALSINTFAAGASLGSSNGVAFRLWVVVFNNGGTNVMALINCSTANNIYALNEGNIATTTPISSGATSAGVFYTPNGTTVSAKSYRILGYLDYASGLATAGTYVNLPTTLQVFGPGIKKPGDIVQSSYTQSGTFASTASNYTQSATLPTIAVGVAGVAAPAFTASSAPNVLRVSGQLVMSNGSNANNMTAFLYNGTAVVSVVGYSSGSSGQAGTPATAIRYQTVAGSSALTFTLYATGSTGTTYVNGTVSQYFGSVANTYIAIDEIMG